MFDLQEALRYVVASEGSDLHLKVAVAPARAHPRSARRRSSTTTRCAAEDTERVLREMLADHHDRMAEFDRENEVDFAYAVAGPGAVPGQRLPSARLGLDRRARDPVRWSGRSTSSGCPP